MMLFQEAMDRDEHAGNGELAMMFADEIAEVPECRNDHEFGFVSGMCGYQGISQMRYTDAFSGNVISYLQRPVGGMPWPL